MIRRYSRLTRVFILASLITAVAFAGLDPVDKNEDGVALRGHDAVAYFTEGKPVVGNESQAYKWKGATWLFSSASNRALFAKDPQRYVPKYGGYCAYAVGNNYVAKGDPEAWTIVNDKLYLNYNKDVRKMWMKDQKALIKKGDQNWPGLLEK
jgi:hypothetical protein